MGHEPPTLMRQLTGEWRIIMQTTRIARVSGTTQEHRHHERERKAQQRLADLSFSRFMQDHNARQENN